MKVDTLLRAAKGLFQVFPSFGLKIAWNFKETKKLNKDLWFL